MYGMMFISFLHDSRRRFVYFVPGYFRISPNQGHQRITSTHSLLIWDAANGALIFESPF